MDEIEVAERTKDGRDFFEFAREALDGGKAVQYYCMGHKTLKADIAAKMPSADVWYTERNGDSIACLVPKGTSPERLPSHAKDYAALEWIDPDKDFGSGVVPLKYREAMGR
jgi:hypothetical protein